jgi:hypothetical protein
MMHQFLHKIEHMNTLLQLTGFTNTPKAATSVTLLMYILTAYETLYTIFLTLHAAFSGNTLIPRFQNGRTLMQRASRLIRDETSLI